MIGEDNTSSRVKSSSDDDCNGLETKTGVEKDQLRKDGPERASSPSGLSTESPNNIIGTYRPGNAA